MKIFNTALAGLMLTIACALLHVYEPSFVKAIGYTVYDTLLRSIHDDPKSDEIAIIDLDEASLQEFGQWPWPRYRVAKLLQQLQDGGASVVAFDMVFAETDRTSPGSLQEDLKKSFGVVVDTVRMPVGFNDFDEVLSRQLVKGDTVLGCYMHSNIQGENRNTGNLDQPYKGRFFTRGKADLKSALYPAADITLPIALLGKSATSTAFFNTSPDYDNVVRSSPLVYRFGIDRIYGSLALEAARLHLHESQIGILHDEGGISHLQLGKIQIPTDAKGNLLINYRNGNVHKSLGSTSYPTFSARNVLNGKLKPDDVKGKVVFIGTSAAGLKDIRATPLSPHFAGVSIHATILDNILSNDFIRLPRWQKITDLTAIIIIGMLLTYVSAHQRSWLAFIFSIFVMLAVFYCSYKMLEEVNLFLNPAPTITSIMILYPVLTMMRFWQQEQKERWIRDTFGLMVSQKVLHYMEDQPDKVSLNGRKMATTVSFTDIEGFTSISEALEPEQLSELLNAYFNPMSGLIMERDGYIDKFVGDMIMAEWGVPYPISDHAKQACLCLLEQQDTLDKLRPELKERYGFDLYTRTGINTGMVTAGNMGSGDRMQYTVMGDTVNLAARLEPLNKNYGTRIIIGEDTFLQTQDVIETRLLDKVQVRGKRKPSLIYELMARKGELTEAQKKMVHLYERALKLSWDKEFDAAMTCIAKALEIVPDDKASEKLKATIERGLLSKKILQGNAEPEMAEVE